MRGHFWPFTGVLGEIWRFVTQKVGRHRGSRWFHGSILAGVWQRRPTIGGRFRTAPSRRSLPIRV